MRRLVAATVTNLASPADTAALAEEANALADRIETHVPAEPPPRFGPGAPELEGPPITHLRAPYDYVTGICNPAAVPVEMAVDMESDPPKTRGRVVFSTVYEGPPGCVHGAAIASAFDMVFTSACSTRNASGPTMMLSVRYRKPTLLDVETVFEGWVETFDGTITEVKGHALQDGQVTALAEGVFRQLDRETLNRLAQTREPDPKEEAE